MKSNGEIWRWRYGEITISALLLGTAPFYADSTKENGFHGSRIWKMLWRRLLNHEYAGQSFQEQSNFISKLRRGCLGCGSLKVQFLTNEVKEKLLRPQKTFFFAQNQNSFRHKMCQNHRNNHLRSFSFLAGVEKNSLHVNDARKNTQYLNISVTLSISRMQLQSLDIL